VNPLYVVLVVLLVIAVTAVPGVAVQHNYGYFPAGGLLGVVLIILIVLFLTGRL
jgi:uncharacterized BrkB/YihY/UPF0761 family membrane protein